MTNRSAKGQDSNEATYLVAMGSFHITMAMGNDQGESLERERERKRMKSFR
jgi:hypothetical protein